ncbi:MAG: DUF4294 domain-containing protein [Flavobacteriaceae bacterium]|nr:DUF4294 domain-containing protein [Flavobacteriaceae bacterium]
MKAYILIGLICYSLAVNAQERDEFIRDSILLKHDFIIIRNDSATINLKPIFVLKRLKFKNSRQGIYYYWYRKKVLKTYPYATLAAERLTGLNNQLAKIKSKRKRRKHIKKIQKYMEGEFTNQLKKMTRSEGRILIKLIYRQTGLSVYKLIKEYRSGWKAFWYQTTARLFKLSLKKEYHPEISGKDYIIEDILQRAFLDGSLIPQSAKIPIDFQKISLNYKTIDYIKEITSKEKN